MPGKTYIAIDLKSFYASVECVDRQLDPLTTNLVVADESRTEKTICLAVSPSLKACGVSGRARLFEANQKVREVNAKRQHNAPHHRFTGKSSNAPELKANPALELDYIVAMPRMARYMEISSQIYGIYLKYVAPEHIHVYSIDKVFIDATQYLKLYKLTAREFTMKLIQDVLHDSLTLTSAVSELVFPGSKILTDEWGGYNSLSKNGYIHEIHVVSGEILPRCHRAISLLKRWILGTLQGSIAPEHLQDYLNEFTFRYNRRKSKSRGLLFYRLLQYAVETAPVTYDEIKIAQPVG